MGDPVSTFLFMFGPPAVFAFAAQLAAAAGTRHRLRRWTAGLWVALVAGLTSWSEEGAHWLGTALFMLTVLGLSFLVAYAGALSGSAAALRLKRRGRG